MGMVADDITELLKRSEAGDGAAAERLLERIYADLRGIARARLRCERADTLDTTALVHEAWLSMARQQQASFDSRRHYFAYAAKAMRHILVDRARQRAAAKRQLPCEATGNEHDGAPDLAVIDQALGRLAALSPRLVRVVELRLFAGLSSSEIARLLGLTERTVERDWLKARALLAQWLDTPR
jgi:RNA polymerase sigma factor (TIGR02999 family)